MVSTTSSWISRHSTPAGRFAGLGVDDHAQRHLGVGLGVDIDVLEMGEAGTRFPLHKTDQPLPPRGTITSRVGHRQHFGNRGPTRVGTLWTSSGNRRRADRRSAGMDSRRGMEAFGPAAQMTAFPDFRHAPASAVTLGRLS